MQLKRGWQILWYGIGFALILLLIKFLEIRYVILLDTFELYAAAIALIFTILGIWIAIKLYHPKTIVIEKEVSPPTKTSFEFNQIAFEQLGLSKRELEVLQLMSIGLSNQEIADQLFVSLNTIKTHVSKVFEKLEVKRRTQAIEVAKKLQIIA